MKCGIPLWKCAPVCVGGRFSSENTLGGLRSTACLREEREDDLGTLQMTGKWPFLEIHFLNSEEIWLWLHMQFSNGHEFPFLETKETTSQIGLEG